MLVCNKKSQDITLESKIAVMLCWCCYMALSFVHALPTAERRGEIRYYLLPASRRAEYACYTHDKTPVECF